MSKCRSVGVSRPYEPHLLDHLPGVRARMSGPMALGAVGPDDGTVGKMMAQSGKMAQRTRPGLGGDSVKDSAYEPSKTKLPRCCFKAQSVLSQWSRSMEWHCTLDCHAN